MEQALLNSFYNTPPLWTKAQFGIPQFRMPELQAFTSGALQIPNNLRLGHQMEFVFKAIVEASDEYELSFSNVLVDEGKQRIGELDFVLQETNTQKYLHVELAYKFYIINPEISEPIYRLMGPNKRDMFYTKLDKLKEKQLPLLFHDSLAPYWDNKGVNIKEVLQQCCFKAQLFAPFGEMGSIRPLNTECIVGQWIRFDDFDSKVFSDAHFYIPQKLQWVLEPHENVPWMRHFETLMEVNLRMVKENAPLLWVQRPSGTLEKLFVVWW